MLLESIAVVLLILALALAFNLPRKLWKWALMKMPVKKVVVFNSAGKSITTSPENLILLYFLYEQAMYSSSTKSKIEPWIVAKLFYTDLLETRSMNSDASYMTEVRYLLHMHIHRKWIVSCVKFGFTGKKECRVFQHRNNWSFAR